MNEDGWWMMIWFIVFVKLLWSIIDDNIYCMCKNIMKDDWWLITIFIDDW
jgi:hypothetical protein